MRYNVGCFEIIYLSGWFGNVALHNVHRTCWMAEMQWVGAQPFHNMPGYLRVIVYIFEMFTTGVDSRLPRADPKLWISQKFYPAKWVPLNAFRFFCTDFIVFKNTKCIQNNNNNKRRLYILVAPLLIQGIHILVPKFPKMGWISK